MTRAMKECDIEWCNTVPENWEIKANKYIMSKHKELCTNYNGEDILSLTMKGVVVRDLDAGGKMPTSFDGYQRIYPNNLLMCLFDYDVTPRCIGLIKNNGLTSPAYSQFVMKDGNSSRYYYYYYLMIDHTKELLHLAKNLRHSFTEEQLGAIKTPVPPVDEQQKIADFLDEKCKHIDSVLEKTRASIEEYKQLKQSVITQAVTKGIRPNRPMKDSGIEWIGEIPEDWKAGTVLRYISFEGGSQPPLTEFVDTPQEGYVRLIQNRDYKTDAYATYVPRNSVSKFCDENDIMVGRYGPPIFVIHRGLAGAYNVAIMKAIPCNELYREYMYFYLQNTTMLNYIESFSARAAGQSGVNPKILKRYPMFLPTWQEQYEIVSYLESKCTEIDNLINKKKNLIEELETYKKSLIYEYVTGKKEVC